MSQYDDPYHQPPPPGSPPPDDPYAPGQPPPQDPWNQGQVPPGSHWQQPGYYQNPYQPPLPGMAIASLILGIVSLPSCMCYGCPSLICGILACIFGTMMLNQVKEGTAPASARGISIAGIICGAVGIVLSFCFWMIGVLGIVLENL